MLSEILILTSSTTSIVGLTSSTTSVVGFFWNFYEAFYYVYLETNNKHYVSSILKNLYLTILQLLHHIKDTNKL
jgi:hypothetical protein